MKNEKRFYLLGLLTEEPLSQCGGRCWWCLALKTSIAKHVHNILSSQILAFGRSMSRQISVLHKWLWNQTQWTAFCWSFLFSHSPMSLDLLLLSHWYLKVMVPLQECRKRTILLYIPVLQLSTSTRFLDPRKPLAHSIQNQSDLISGTWVRILTSPQRLQDPWFLLPEPAKTFPEPAGSHRLSWWCLKPWRNARPNKVCFTTLLLTQCEP